MKFFIDSADLEAIREIKAMGMCDGVTTNPSLMAKAGRTDTDALLKDARVWGTRQALFKRALPRIDESAANAALADAARIDRMIKGIGGGDVWTEFLRLGLKFAGR